MIDMVYRKLVNLQTPTDPFDAATKDYVDYVAETLKESLNNTIDKKEKKKKKTYIHGT